MDIDYLLNPFVSKEETVKRWKNYLLSQGKPQTFLEINKLAKELVTNHYIDKQAINSLFNRGYIFPKEVVYSLKDFKPPDLENLNSFGCPDDLIEELVKRIKYPEESLSSAQEFGPNNSDLNSGSKWCHELENTFDVDVNHGMFKCECFDEIDLKDMACETCHKKIVFGKDFFIRDPIVDKDFGGWKDIYCSTECLYNVSNSTLFQEIIIEVSEVCLKS